MKQDIYRLANEVEMDSDRYQDDGITELETKRIEQYVKQNAPDHKEPKNDRRNNRPRKIAAAAAVLLCVGAGMMFNSEVYAFVEQVSYKISSIWELNNVDKYVNVINTSQQDQGYTVTLNEVILDHDELIICQTITGPGKLDDYVLANGSLKIDGKRIDTGGSGGGEVIDDYMQEDIFYYSIPKDQLSMNGSHDIEYSITELGQFAGTDVVNIKGNWTFRFTVTGEELSRDTVQVEMKDEVVLSEGLSLKFTKYSGNAVNQKIYFNIIGDYLDFNCDMELRGVDDLGNPVVFFMSSISDGEGVFKVDTSENGYINKDAKRLVLSLYTAEMPLTSGRMNSTYELFKETKNGQEAGKEIIIDISR